MSGMRRVMITGCDGMFGRAIHFYFAERSTAGHASDHRPSAPWLCELDVRDGDGMAREARAFRPDLIINFAAETDLEFCEAYPDEARGSNVDGAEIVARVARDLGAIHVYIRTTGVFDDRENGFYTEDDDPNPIKVNGATKIDGEWSVPATCERHYVVRASWIFGGGPGCDHKFVSKIPDRLPERDAFGTYHMVCEGAGTRYDVAREIVAISGRKGVAVRAVSSDFFATEYFAPRPRSEMLANARLRAIGLNLMRPWQVALRDYIHEHYPAVLA